METLLHNLIQATGWSILHSIWQSAIIFALFFPTQLKVFRLSSKLKYALAFAANCCMFICFTYTFLSVLQWPGEPASLIAEKQMTYTNAVAVSSVYLSFIHSVEALFPYLALLYSLGLFVQSFIVFQGYRRVQLLKKAVHIAIPKEWNLLFESLIKKLEIRKQVSFYLSDHVRIPLVIGYLKPVVLFPVALVSQMDIKQVEAILIHELSHVRRNDYIFNIIKTMIDTLLFFNPFLRLMGRFIDIEREHACDDQVISLTSTPLNYAHALLKLEILMDKRSPVLALAATGKSQHLYQRIKRITDMKTNYMNSKQKLFMLTLTIATIFSLAWISPAKNEGHLKKSIVKNTQPLTAAVIRIPLDTGKKNAKKVVQVKKVKSIAPEISIQSDVDSIISPDVSNIIADFAVNVTDMALSSTTDDMHKMKIEIEAQGQRLQHALNSPAQKAKWEKYADEIEAKYNSPEQKEKIRKLQKQASAQAKEIQIRINSPEFKRKIAEMKLNNTEPVTISSENGADEKIKQNPEYIMLKNKFDKDVEKLINKELKEESK